MRLHPLWTALAIPALSTAVLVKDVNQGRIWDLLAAHDLLLAAFTSSTLDSLQAFHAVFAQVASEGSTPFVTVNCDVEQDLCKTYDVNSYPTIRLFKRKEEFRERRKKEKDGEGQGDRGEADLKYHGVGDLEDMPEREVDVIRYRGRRTKSAIRSFITKHELPTLSHIEPDVLDDFKKIDDIVFLAYLRPDQEALLEVFRSVAERYYSDYVFGYLTDMPTADKEGRAMPSIACYKNTDGDHKVMSGHFAEEDVEAFLETASKSLIGEVKERNMGTYMAKDKLTVYVFASTEDSATSMRRELTPLAKKYEKYIKMGVADAVEYAPMAQNYGLSGDKFPALAVHAPMNDHVFVYKQGRKIAASVVEAMLTTILQGKAANGQVFGDEAEELDDEGGEGRRRHDEL